MTAKSKLRGHSIESIGGAWYFSDSGEPVKETHSERPCGHCGKKDTAEGHDGCLGVLPGLMNACCGHGVASDAYAQFLDGSIAKGSSAKIILAELKKI